MTKQVWLNLPVKDLENSKAFYEKIGFSLNKKHGTPVSDSILVGQNNFVVMLFEENTFKHIVGNAVSDATKVSEVLISIDAENPEEVDEMARRVEAAGGNLFSKPMEHQGWMYGCAFADLDGHRWNILYMDMNKMPK